MSVVTFHSEDPRELLPELSKLWSKHFEEIAVHRELFGEPNPNVELYQALADRGILFSTTARWGGNLVGYFLFMVGPAPHYKHVQVATEDLYYLVPEARKGLLGYKFLAAAVEQMKQAGAAYASVRSKLSHDNGPLLRRLGFIPTDMVWQKVLK